MGRTLSEHESMLLLAEHGVPVVPERVVATPAEAGEVAAELGWPVVLKLTGANVAHKTERGLVRLRLCSRDDVEGAAADLLAAARPEDGDVALLVAPMVTGSRELIAGLHTDPQFGRCVMIGVGGILAEALADVAFRVVPIGPVDAQEMLDDLRSAALLGPVRGEAPVDRAAVASVLLSLSTIASTHPEIVSLDVNPLVVVDGAPVAVDALVELADQGARP